MQAVPVTSEAGAFVVPVLINGEITLNFIVDSGAADVTITVEVVSTLIRTGSIKPEDLGGRQTYYLADGSAMPSNTFVIKSLKVGDVVVENVQASVAPSQGELLLGQAFLRRFGA